MSRIGNKPIPVPSGVDVSVSGSTVTVKGPKAKKPLTWQFPGDIVQIASADGTVKVSKRGETKFASAMWGTARALVANMVTGANEGFVRALEVYGIGFNVAVDGSELVLNIGFNAPRRLAIPEGIDVTVEAKAARGNDEPAKFSIAGADKQALGQFFALIRRQRPPEPYKGKGIREKGEQIVRKGGKSFVSGG